jgi:hypothetical protein
MVMPNLKPDREETGHPNIDKPTERSWLLGPIVFVPLAIVLLMVLSVFVFLGLRLG